ncbi:MAG: isoprenylcysteine carboxylmethyltransferase family protein [Methylococcales bacterium]|nr:isoprenylcysteine carboxylmethyltransferase family protein [Methylococcales bacterium]
MANLFNRWGNFFFQTRNVLFPVLIALVLFLWPPVAIDNVPGVYLMIAGLLMVVIGQGLRILTIGLVYIVRGGRKRRIYAKKLVTDGLFSHCRNPLYVGNILIVIGFLFISGNVTGMIAGSLVFLAIYRLIVYSEESFLSTTFAEAYTAYCADVPRWIPRFKGLRETISHYQFDWPAVAVKEYGTIFTSLMISLGLVAWKLHLANRLVEYQLLLTGFAILIVAAYGIVRYLKKTERLKSMR